MSEKNGKAVVVPAQKSEDIERYRPKADRRKVHEQIVDSLRDVAREAAYHASQYVSLVYYDRDKSPVVRYRHAVDASECLELAMDYLNLLKNELGHQMRVENDDDPAQRD